MTEPIFLICPQNGKTATRRFFEFIKKILIFYFCWIWSIMKVYIIYYILAQISCLGKIYFLRYALGHLDCRIFKSNIYLEQNDEIAWYFAVWDKCLESKIWKILGWGWSKWVWLLWSKSSRIFYTQDGMIFHADINSGKLKRILITIGWVFSKWMWPIRSWHCSICCIARIIWWIELIFCLLIPIQKVTLLIFVWSWSKMSMYF